MPVAVWEDGIDIKTHLCRLYKYRSMDGEFGRTAVKDAIVGNRLFWQNPLNFNDPFDCKPTWVMDETPAQRARRIADLARIEFPQMTRKLRRGFRQYVEHKSRGISKQALNYYHHKHVNQWAVTCFSMVCDSLLMWAHYADSHKGVCLIFDEILTPSPFVAFKVYYSGKRPLRYENEQGDAMEEFKKAVLTKGADWSYEQECRFMDYRSAAGYRSFPPEALRGVILGANISDADASFVRSLVSLRKTGIEVFRSRIHEEEFRINIELDS